MTWDTRELPPDAAAADAPSAEPPAAGLEFVIAEDPAILRPIEQASHRRTVRSFSCPTYLFGMENHQ